MRHYQNSNGVNYKNYMIVLSLNLDVQIFCSLSCRSISFVRISSHENELLRRWKGPYPSLQNRFTWWTATGAWSSRKCDIYFFSLSCSLAFSPSNLTNAFKLSVKLFKNVYHEKREQSHRGSWSSQLPIQVPSVTVITRANSLRFFHCFSFFYCFSSHKDFLQISTKSF